MTVAVTASVAFPSEKLAPDWLALAAAHVRIAEATRDKNRLWGRLGGSEAERAAARLMERQLKAWLEAVELEPFSFAAHRPLRWRLKPEQGAVFASAMPTPFDARFSEREVRAAVQQIVREEDWQHARGKWAFVHNADPAKGISAVREGLLYERAKASAAAGFIFSAPYPKGLGAWRAVLPLDKPFALRDERYPDGRRPLLCFSVDATDGERLLATARAGHIIGGQVTHEARTQREGLNVVGYLPGQGRKRVAFFSHLDSFFSGANDNASGIATNVGLAARLAGLPIGMRRADFYFIGQSAHHDAGAGMRAFRAKDPRRFAALDYLILLEHTDAQAGREGTQAGWPANFNQQRRAFLKLADQNGLRQALPALVRESRLMTAALPIVDECIGDLLAVCGEHPSFSLIQAPPYYHTEHDTLDKLSRAGIERAIDFHLRLLEVIGAVAPKVGR